MRRNDPQAIGALALAYARGRPAATGVIRRRPEDFRVDEYLGFEGSGDGPHVLLQVEKTGCNTAETAGMLAAHAAVPVSEVGYSGLKDRYAVCTQWFSVPYSPRDDWEAFAVSGLRILQAVRHRRKLKRGTHVANRFRIRIELDPRTGEAPGGRLEIIRDAGVPNYFGEQRFGRRCADDAERLAAGRRLPRLQRSMTLSAIRSDLFNRLLDRRVRDGTWDTALPGEYLNLDGTRVGFAAEDDDPEIPARVAAMDLHPTAPLFGAGSAGARGEAASLEEEVLGQLGRWRDLLLRHGLKMERRATRCAVRELDWELDEGRSTLDVRFVLRRGQFATSVLREVVDYRDVTRGESATAGAAGQPRQTAHGTGNCL